MSGLPPGWVDDYDGVRWVYRYKPTGLTQYKFPRAGDEFPEHIAAYGMFDLAPEERLASEQQVRRRSGTDAAQSAPMSTGAAQRSGPLETVGEMSATGYFDPSSYYYDGCDSPDEDDIIIAQDRKKPAEQSYVVSPDAATPSSAPLANTNTAQVDASPPAVSSHTTGVSAVSNDSNTFTSGHEETTRHMLHGQSLPAELSGAGTVSEAPDNRSPLGYLAELATSDTLKCADELAPIELDASTSLPGFSGMHVNPTRPVELPTDASPRKPKQAEPRRASAPVAAVESYPLTSASFSFPPLKSETIPVENTCDSPQAPSSNYQTWHPSRLSAKTESGNTGWPSQGSPEVSVLQAQENDLATNGAKRYSVTGEATTSGMPLRHPTVLTPQPGPSFGASSEIQPSNNYPHKSPIPAILKPAQSDTHKHTVQQSGSTNTTVQIPGTKARHESISIASDGPSTIDQKEAALNHAPSILKPARNRQSMLASLHEQQEWHAHSTTADSKKDSNPEARYQRHSVMVPADYQSGTVVPTDNISELSAATRVPAFFCITEDQTDDNAGRPTTQRVQTAPLSLPSQEAQRPILNGPGFYLFQEIPSARQQRENFHLPDGNHKDEVSKPPIKVSMNATGNESFVQHAGFKPSIVAVPKFDATSVGEHKVSSTSISPHQHSSSQPPKVESQPLNSASEEQTTEQCAAGHGANQATNSDMCHAPTTTAPLAITKPPNDGIQSVQIPTHTETASHSGKLDAQLTPSVHTLAASLTDVVKPSTTHNDVGTLSHIISRPNSLPDSSPTVGHSNNPNEMSASFSHQSPTSNIYEHVISASFSGKPPAIATTSHGKIPETPHSTFSSDVRPTTNSGIRPPSLPSQVSSPTPSISSAHQTPSSTFSQPSGTVVEPSPPVAASKPSLPLRPASAPWQQTGSPTPSNNLATGQTPSVSQLQTSTNNKPHFASQPQPISSSANQLSSSQFQSSSTSQIVHSSQPGSSQSVSNPSASTSPPPLPSQQQQQQRPPNLTSQPGTWQTQASGQPASVVAQSQGTLPHTPQFSSGAQPQLSSAHLPAGSQHTASQVSTQPHFRPPQVQTHAQYQPQQFTQQQSHARPPQTQTSYPHKPHTQQSHTQQSHAQQSHAQHQHTQHPHAQHPHVQHRPPHQPHSQQHHVQHPHLQQSQSSTPQNHHIPQHHPSHPSQSKPPPTQAQPVKPSTAAAQSQQPQTTIPSSIDTAAVLANAGKEFKGWAKRVLKNPALRQTAAVAGGMLVSDSLGGDAMAGAMLANKIYETSQAQPAGGGGRGAARPPGPVHAQTAPPQAPGIPGPRPPVQVVPQPVPGMQPIGIQTPGRPFAVQNPAMAGAPVQAVQPLGPPGPGQTVQAQSQWQQDSTVQMQYNNQQTINNNVSFSANLNESTMPPPPGGLVMSEQAPVQIQNTLVIDNSTSDSYFAPQQPGGMDVTNVYIDNSNMSNVQTSTGTGDGTSYYTDNTYVNDTNINMQASGNAAEATYYTDNSNTYTNDTTTYTDASCNASNTYVNDTTYVDSTYNAENTYVNDAAYVDTTWTDTTNVNVNVDMDVNVEVDQSYMAAGQDSYAFYGSTDIVAEETVTASVDYSGGDWGGDW